MRLLATIGRVVRGGDRLRRAKLAALPRGRRTDEGRTVVADVRLPASSMLRTGDNRNLSLTDEDLGG